VSATRTPWRQGRAGRTKLSPGCILSVLLLERDWRDPQNNSRKSVAHPAAGVERWHGSNASLRHSRRAFSCEEIDLLLSTTLDQPIPSDASDVVAVVSLARTSTHPPQASRGQLRTRLFQELPHPPESRPL